LVNAKKGGGASRECPCVVCVRGDGVEPGMGWPVGIENVTSERVGEKVLEDLGELREPGITPENRRGVLYGIEVGGIAWESVLGRGGP